MPYHDNAILMKLRLGLWDAGRTPRPYEIEAELLAELHDTCPEPPRRRLRGLWRWGR